MSSAPLIISRDAGLVDELLRLAAAAGVTPDVMSETRSLLRSWSTVAAVLVGADLADEVARAAPPRREGVHVVVRGEVPDRMFRVALGVGAEHVAQLPHSEGWLVELLTDVGEGARQPGLTIGLIGGSGGAGATTFACALGVVAARSGPALVVDLDPLGPGVDRVLGFDGQDGIRWEALQQTTGRLSARSMREAVPARRGLGVLTWGPGPADPVPVFAVREALSAARRGFDTVVVDLPRLVDPVVAEVVARCDRVVVLTVPSLGGIAASARLAARLGTPSAVHVIRGVGLDGAAVSRATGLAVLATMRDQRGLDEAVGLGAGPVQAARGVLARAAADVLDRLGPSREAA